MITYRHWRLKNGGAVTVACEVVPDTEDYLFSFGFAFCSPKDRFNKKIGRLIASGRLAKQRWYYERYTGGLMSESIQHRINCLWPKLLNQGAFDHPAWVEKELAELLS